MGRKTIFLSTSDKSAKTLAHKFIEEDGLIVFPTDTIYGLACNPFSSKAIKGIYSAKDRPIDKAIPILIGHLDQISQFSDHIPRGFYFLQEKFWPGPLTMVIKKKAGLPDELSQSISIGIRMPNHPFSLDLLKITGPLAVSSANISGKQNPIDAFEVSEQLDGKVDLILDGGSVQDSTPSTVVDCTGPIPEILRQGIITYQEILETWPK